MNKGKKSLFFRHFIEEDNTNLKNSRSISKDLKIEGYMRPKQKEGIQTRFYKEDERGKFFICSTENSFLKLHEAGRDILQLLDGKTNLSQIERWLDENNLKIDLFPFIELLYSKNFLIIPELDKELEKIGSKRDEKTSRWHRSSWYLTRFEIVKDGKNIASKLHKVFFWVYSWPFILFFMSITFLGTIIFLLWTNEIILEVEVIFTGREALFYFLFFILVVSPFMILIHELAHALTCYHYKRTPRDLGIAFYVFMPVFYANTTDMWLGSRKEQVITSLAGPLANLFISSGLGVFAYIFPEFSVILLRIAIIGYYMFLFSLNPLMKSDGFHIIQAITGFAKLYDHSLTYARLMIHRIVNRASRSEYLEFLSVFSKAEKRILKLYTPAVFLWTLILMLFPFIYLQIMVIFEISLAISIIQVPLDEKPVYLILFLLRLPYVAIIPISYIALLRSRSKK